jgi:hypothetical protein
VFANDEQTLAWVGDVAFTPTIVPPPTNRDLMAVVRATVDSPWGMELFMQTTEGLQPVQMGRQEATAAADIDVFARQSHAVKLMNDSPRDVAVALAVDGVNSLIFSQDAEFAKSGLWLIPAHDVVLIEGWHVAGNNVTPFRLDEYSDRLAEGHGATLDEPGVIRATFYEAYPVAKAGPPEKQSAIAAQRVCQRLANQATSHGEIRPQSVVVGPELISIALRYVKRDPTGIPP